MAGYATTYWSTTSTTSNSSTYSYSNNYSSWVKAWNWKPTHKETKDKLDECKIEDEELLDLIRDDE